jgi:hypothetical protein
MQVSFRRGSGGMLVAWRLPSGYGGGQRMIGPALLALLADAVFEAADTAQRAIPAEFDSYLGRRGFMRPDPGLDDTGARATGRIAGRDQDHAHLHRARVRPTRHHARSSR